VLAYSAIQRIDANQFRAINFAATIYHVVPGKYIYILLKLKITRSFFVPAVRQCSSRLAIICDRIAVIFGVLLR